MVTARHHPARRPAQATSTSARRARCMKRDRCTFCRKKLEIGAELTIRQRGVEGHRGPIPLDEVEVFCSDACERDHLTDIPDGPVRCP